MLRRRGINVTNYILPAILVLMCLWFVYSHVHARGSRVRIVVQKEEEYSKNPIVALTVENANNIPVKSEKIQIPEVVKWKFNSQQNEDVLMLDEYFTKKDISGSWMALYNGVFLEVGAFDGIKFSNTFVYQKYLKWTGVLIEGCPGNANALKNNRESVGVKIYTKAVCSADTQPRVVKYSQPCLGEAGILGEYGDFRLRKAHSSKSQYVETPCAPMSEILKDSGLKFIDFMSVDVEGYESKLLKSIDFKAIQIRVIVVETDHNMPEELEEIRRVLSSEGFISKGLCCGSYANEIWENPNFKRADPEVWIPVVWNDKDWVKKTVWRLHACEKAPKERFDRALERDKNLDTTFYTQYISSFEERKCPKKT